MKITKSYLREMIKESLKLEMGTKKKPKAPEAPEAPEAAGEPLPTKVETISAAYEHFLESRKEAAMYEITNQYMLQGRLFLKNKNGKITAVLSNRLGSSYVTDKDNDLYLTDPNNIETRPIKY